MDFREENGVVIIEATIALTAFMFFIVTILSIVNVCYAQAKIGAALNETAKEISEYSYLYALTGLNEKQKELYDASEGTRSQMDDTIQGVEELMGAFQTGSDAVSDVNMDNLSEKIEKLDTSVEHAESAKAQLENTFSDIAENPKAFLIGFAKLMGNGMIETAKSRVIAAPLTKSLIKKHLKSTENGNCEDFLRNLRVIPGADNKYINGIDFSKSALFPDGSEEIILVAKYKVKVVALLPVDWEFEFCQTAETVGWFGN